MVVEVVPPSLLCCCCDSSPNAAGRGDEEDEDDDGANLNTNVDPLPWYDFESSLALDPIKAPMMMGCVIHPPRVPLYCTFITSSEEVSAEAWVRNCDMETP